MLAFIPFTVYFMNMCLGCTQCETQTEKNTPMQQQWNRQVGADKITNGKRYNLWLYHFHLPLQKCVVWTVFVLFSSLFWFCCCCIVNAFSMRSSFEHTECLLQFSGNFITSFFGMPEPYNAPIVASFVFSSDTSVYIVLMLKKNFEHLR